MRRTKTESRLYQKFLRQLRAKYPGLHLYVLRMAADSFAKMELKRREADA